MENLEQYESAVENAPFFLKMTFDEEGSVSIDEMQNQDGIILSAEIPEDDEGTDSELDWKYRAVTDTSADTKAGYSLYLLGNQDCLYTGVRGSRKNRLLRQRMEIVEAGIWNRTSYRFFCWRWPHF